MSRSLLVHARQANRDLDFRGDEYAIRDIFERARAEAPCVLVLEDLDSLITELNRSFFLNEVDGLEENDGLLLVSCHRPYIAETARSAPPITLIDWILRCPIVLHDLTANSEYRLGATMLISSQRLSESNSGRASAVCGILADETEEERGDSLSKRASGHGRG